jgi:hypothetical protein
MGNDQRLPLGPHPMGTVIEGHFYPIEVIYTDQKVRTRVTNPKQLRQDVGYIVIAVSVNS